jgi:uncharacterized membrane protein
MIDLAGQIPSSLDLHRLSHYFTSAENESYRQRRKLIVLAIAGIADAAFIALRQNGILKKLPDLPGGIFDANKVTVSEKAYDLGLPDTGLSLLTYSAVITLASWGGDRKLYRKKWMDKLLFAATAVNALAAAQYFLNMALKQKKICFYCVTATAINFSVLNIAWKELRHE